MRFLNSSPKIPWLCNWDFNKITKQDEKLGGATQSHIQMQLFREIINECSFMDLGYVGSKFTWSKQFKNGNSIWERLDRGLATNGWFLKFPGSRVHHLQFDYLDHSPLLVVLAPLDIPTCKKMFQFEEMWLSNPTCEEIVQASWNSMVGSNLDTTILSKVENFGKDLLWWNRNVFGSVRQELIKKKELLCKAKFEAQISGINH